MAHNIPFNV